MLRSLTLYTLGHISSATFTPHLMHSICACRYHYYCYYYFFPGAARNCQEKQLAFWRAEEHAIKVGNTTRTKPVAIYLCRFRTAKITHLQTVAEPKEYTCVSTFYIHMHERNRARFAVALSYTFSHFDCQCCISIYVFNSVQQ